MDNTSEDDLMILECGSVKKEHRDEFFLDPPPYDFNKLERWLIVMLTYHLDVEMFVEFIDEKNDDFTPEQFSSFLTLVHVYIQLNLQKLVNAKKDLRTVLKPVEPKDEMHHKYFEIVNKMFNLHTKSTSMDPFIKVVKKEGLKSFDEIIAFLGELINLKKDMNVNKLLEDILNEEISIGVKPSATAAAADPEVDLDELSDAIVVSETKYFYNKIMSHYDFLSIYKKVFGSFSNDKYVKDRKIVFAVDFFYQFMNDKITNIDDYANKEDVIEYFAEYAPETFTIEISFKK